MFDHVKPSFTPCKTQFDHVKPSFPMQKWSSRVSKLHVHVSMIRICSIYHTVQLGFFKIACKMLNKISTQLAPTCNEKNAQTAEVSMFKCWPQSYKPEDQWSCKRSPDILAYISKAQNI